MFKSITLLIIIMFLLSIRVETRPIQTPSTPPQHQSKQLLEEGGCEGDTV
ncbi:hypothetical protein TorRG33x02_110310 [Trema orientale]|uniref:Transmembrane protein n=1 Tax=Trema orientale TaxID=63057 RepID=A0A2P5F5R3_TREOI|nr:hypothetical protein TorRG33x02_110310 [Trema orientale]